MKCAKVRSGIDLTVQPNTPFVPSYQIQQYDTGDFFNLAQPDRFTIPKSGAYHVGAALIWEVNNTGNREFGLTRVIDANSNPPITVDLAYQAGPTIQDWNVRQFVALDAFFEKGNQVVVFTRHSSDVPLRLFHVDDISVTFWIHQVDTF